ncbi:MAG: hypothetical protein Q9227_005875 [Pyrenula ochraceoflavens]
MHKYRSLAKRTAWYDDDDDPATYNPFKKYRARRLNTLNDAENGDGTLRRAQSDNVRPASSAAQATEMRGAVAGKTHAQTLPARRTHPPTSSSEDADYNLPRSASPGIEDVQKEAEPNEKDLTPVEEHAKDSTSSNTIVPTADQKQDNSQMTRRRRPMDRLKGIIHGDVGGNDADDNGKGKDGPKFTPMSQLRATLFNSWINLLLVFVPVGIIVNYLHINPIAVFILNFVAIIPLAALLSYATEEIALRVGEVLGGLLNATFGNAVELIVSILALVQNQIVIVKTSLIGSMLSNLLLVLGMCFFFGGYNRLEQQFNMVVAQTAASLLALAAASLIIPTVFKDWNDTDHDLNTAPLSRGTAVILLFVYGCYLLFQLKSHAELYNEPSPKSDKRNMGKLSKGEARKSIVQAGAGIGASAGGENAVKPVDQDDDQEEPQLTLWVAIFTLAASTVLVALCAEYMVDNIDAITHCGGGISKTFVGLILLPIVGNAAEHATSVTVAVKDKMDLAIGVAVGSSMQIALLVLPLIVVIGWIMGKNDMTLDFDGYYLSVFFVAVLLVNYLIQDGKSHWLEGVLLQTLYIIIAVGAWFYPNSAEQCAEEG